ncbi:hypothetical protein [Methylobacillus flagellatus]|uniref:Transmembrane protein n=1 Tax=Methylobacillus flagellatus (strain ATCC 51484 / DSM 6875 / VKM B-1610 / KT) TaxID=265072 RepID=Q1GXP7_METFK|nr:hypothetical protein [Methylobacillus flagellatus]ABE50990.1 hypothetical protein Mfla_2727 [Methylobacillus flagellatus KT]
MPGKLEMHDIEMAEGRELDERIANACEQDLQILLNKRNLKEDLRNKITNELIKKTQIKTDTARHLAESSHKLTKATLWIAGATLLVSIIGVCITLLK